MQIPEIPTLPTDIMESLPRPVQEHIRDLRGIMALLLEQQTQVQQRMTDLEQRLNQNSENSSKPPSMNPPCQRPPKTPKAKSVKKRGGQAGHERHSRQLLPATAVDDVREWWPQVCKECKAPLRASDQSGTPKRHQVYEIERVRAKVTEHQFFACECRFCSTLTTAPSP
jgi:transposase